MDAVHHALIGGAGYLVATEHGHQLAGMAFVAGSVFPDLDVALIAFGKRFYLRHHQGITHSLPLSPLYALGCAAPLLALEGWRTEVVLAALLGLWVHVALDLCNTFRIAPFAPFSRRRASLDAVFFVDATALGLTGVFYLGYAVLGIGPTAWAYALAFTGHLLARGALQRRVRRATGAEFAIPSALHPFEFYLLWRERGGFRTCLFNALSARQRDEEFLPAAGEADRAMAEGSPIYRDMREILRALEVVAVERDERGVRLHAADLAVRNFGGRFGHTVVEFDPTGRLLRESTAI